MPFLKFPKWDPGINLLELPMKARKPFLFFT